MDASVFRDDSTKVTVIMTMLAQANELLGDVNGHLKDYGERLGREVGHVDQSHLLETERLKQSLYEKEDELRTLRAERIKLADDLQQALTKLAMAEQNIAELTTTRASTETSLESRCRQLEEELRRANEDKRTYARRLTRANTQVEALLRTREGLLDLVQTPEVSIQLPTPLPAEAPPKSLEEPAS